MAVGLSRRLSAQLSRPGFSDFPLHFFKQNSFGCMSFAGGGEDEWEERVKEANREGSELGMRL